MTKSLKIVTMAAIVAAVVMVGAANCSCQPAHITPNVVTFGVGETVGPKTKQQFLSIESDQQWSITINYIAPEGVEDWCTLSRESGEGMSNVLMSFGVNTLEEERVLVLRVQFESELLLYRFTQLSENNGDNPADLSGWIELPALGEQQSDDIILSRHMLPSTSSRERNYSVLYDTDNFIPLWVAYPLCQGNMVGSGNRTDDWGILDPNIPAEQQLNMKYSYQGSYDRGHMLPSASRLRSNDDNRQTFYPTNMTPQLSGLNQKKWAGIEGQVRDWAVGCDTLYVVTGAVLQTVGGGEEVKYTYCKSDSQKQVAIPNYYYKALLQYRNNNGSKSYEAIAIWVPHTPATGVATLTDAITIDQLEKMTGIDFFHSLDDTVEERVESKITNQFWGLK